MPRTNLLQAKPIDLIDLFPQFEQIRHESIQAMLKAEYLGAEAKLPLQGSQPILRYIPSRKTLQRMIMKAAYLPKHFDHFD